MIDAPWTSEQCAKLNEWQACGWVHEFTCRHDHAGGRVLVANPDGWRCPSCGYRQNWAHDFMFSGAPENLVTALLGNRKDGSSPLNSNQGNGE